VSTGGFTTRIGLEPTNEAMTVLGGSDYGSSFYIVEKPAGGKIDFHPRRFSRNWHPENLFHAIQLLALSLGNVVAFLRLRGGDTTKDIKLQWLEDGASYGTPWTHHIGVTASNFDYNLTSDDIAISTKEQVLEEIRSSTDAGTGGPPPPAA
jgi:hypothetical protein